MARHTSARSSKDRALDFYSKGYRFESCRARMTLDDERDFLETAGRTDLDLKRDCFS